MRKVRVFEHERIKGVYERVEKGVATFHQFGVDSNPTESAPELYSTAIIEWPDGKVDNVYVGMIEFIVEDPKQDPDCDDGAGETKSCGDCDDVGVCTGEELS